MTENDYDINDLLECIKSADTDAMSDILYLFEDTVDQYIKTIPDLLSVLAALSIENKMILEDEDNDEEDDDADEYKDRLLRYLNNKNKNYLSDMIEDYASKNNKKNIEILISILDYFESISSKTMILSRYFLPFLHEKSINDFNDFKFFITGFFKKNAGNIEYGYITELLRYIPKEKTNLFINDNINNLLWLLEKIGQNNLNNFFNEFGSLWNVKKIINDFDNIKKITKLFFTNFNDHIQMNMNKFEKLNELLFTLSSIYSDFSKHFEIQANVNYITNLLQYENIPTDQYYEFLTNFNLQDPQYIEINTYGVDNNFVLNMINDISGFHNKSNFISDLTPQENKRRKLNDHSNDMNENNQLDDKMDIDHEIQINYAKLENYFKSTSSNVSINFTQLWRDEMDKLPQNCINFFQSLNAKDELFQNNIAPYLGLINKTTTGNGFFASLIANLLT
ncbi:MAG: hypothetical protein K2Q14_05860 [Gammaproteobacteria bacterium]|nr:hypothetical protein [Gammaproteobacteria bacterium]